MLQAISELLEAPPHERKNVHLPPPAWPIYRDGYYTGVIAALRVADLAEQRFKLAVRTRRAIQRKREPAA